MYYLLNKPRGVVTTSKDTHGRPTVIELVPAEPRVFSVGRLDADTEGLLLLTNDGELANRIAHPSHGVEKEYLAEIAGGAGVARRAPPTPRRGRTRRRHHRTGQGVAAGSPGLLRITIHEGTQPPGSPDVRGRRPSGDPAGADADRPAVRSHAVPGRWRELEAAERRSLIEAVAADPRQYNRST